MILVVLFFLLFSAFVTDVTAVVIDGQGVSRAQNYNTPVNQIAQYVSDIHNTPFQFGADDKRVIKFDLDNSGRAIPKKTHKDLKIKIKSSDSVMLSEESEKVDYEAMAYKAFNEHDIPLALGYYNRILKNNSKHTEALFGAAASYQILGQNDEATNLYMQLLKIQPKNREVINNLMLILADTDVDAAISTIQKIHKTDPDDTALLSQLGSLMYQTDQYHKALRCFKIVLTKSPHDPIVLHSIGATYDSMGNKRGAIAFYKMALENLKHEHRRMLKHEDVHSRIKALSSTTD